MNVRPLILVFALLALVSCSSDEGADSPGSVETATVDTVDTVEPTLPPTESAPSTPPTRSTSTSPTSDVPTSIIDAEIDWRHVIETLGQRRQDLYATPDLVAIPDVCGDGSPCAEQLDVQIGDLADKGWRVEGAEPFTVIDARVEKFDGDSLETSLLVTVVAVIQRTEIAGTIVDSSGAKVAAVEPETEVGFNAQGRFLLGRVGPPEDPWRLISQDTLPEVPA